jgi:hypothetical protein
MKLSKNYKRILIFFLISLLFKPIWLFNNQDLGKPGNDDLSNWLHSATLAYDYDIEYIDDYEVEYGVFNDETGTPYHPPGAGYLSAPFVFISSLFDSEPPDRLNPVGSFGYLGYFFSSLFYFLLGTYLIIKIFIKKNISNYSVIVFSILSGTLVHYVTTRFMMSHAVEYFLCAALCYFFETRYRFSDNRALSAIAILYLLLSFTRPSTFLYSLCLIIYYLNAEDFNFKNFIKLTLYFLGVVGLHVSLSLKIYNTTNILQNYQPFWAEQDLITGTESFKAIFENSPKLFALFFSPSLGIIWSIPVILFGLIAVFINKDKNTDKLLVSKLFLFLYFFGALVVLMLWEGRDVAFGQRLLIGLIPFCSLRIAEIRKNLIFNKLFYFFTTISYLGYIYLYSSNNLTLKRGLSLWGRTVGFTGEDYFIYLLKEIFLIENIISVFARSIYSVNLFSFIKFEDLSRNLHFNFISSDKLSSFSELTNIYYDVSVGYLLVVNILIITFCFLLSNLIISKDN